MSSFIIYSLSFVYSILFYIVTVMDFITCLRHASLAHRLAYASAWVSPPCSHIHHVSVMHISLDIKLQRYFYSSNDVPVRHEATFYEEREYL